MHKKLWFVSDGRSVLSVHTSEDNADRDYYQYEEEPDFEYFSVYPLRLNELDDYEEEYELALEEGLII